MRRPIGCCLGLFGLVVLCVVFAALFRRDPGFAGFAGFAGGGGFVRGGPFYKPFLLLPHQSGDAAAAPSVAQSTSNNAQTQSDTDAPWGPPLPRVRAAFATLCPRVADRPDNLPCNGGGASSGHALRRLRPVLPASVGPSLRASPPCGPGNVVARLRVGDAVRMGAPHLYHMFLDEFARRPPICTYPAREDKWVSRSLQNAGIWDAPLAQFFVRTLTQPHQGGGGIVVDVGANVGAMTLLSASLGFRTFAFEASRRTARMLARTVRMNGLESRVTVLNNALGDGLYYSRLIVPKDNRGGSALGLSREEFGVNINEKAGATIHEDRVSVVCLDTMVDYLDVVLPAEGLPRVVTLMKIDVERLEPLVLRGGAEFFSRFDVRTIVLEISSFGWSVIGCEVKGVVGALLEIGYVMSTQDGALVRNTAEFEHWSGKIHLEKTQVNVVFTRKQQHHRVKL